MYGAAWRQWLVRPGANYRLSEQWQLSLTYSYFSVHPGGLLEPRGAVAEHRMHQQAEYSHRWKNNVVRHRFRLEERWLSSPWREGEPRSWRWQDRPRYMLRVDKPLRRAGSNGGPITLTWYNEVLFSFRSPAPSAFEQNRVYGGIQWKLSRNFSLDLGAFHMAFKPQNGGRLEHNIVFSHAAQEPDAAQRPVRLALEALSLFFPAQRARRTHRSRPAYWSGTPPTSRPA